MEIKTEILEPVIRVGLTESQLTTLRLILLEEKLAARVMFNYESVVHSSPR